MSLIGHNKQKSYFSNLIKRGSLGHAYLFSGPEMVGKKSFALEIYSLINGRDAKNDPDFKLIGPKILEDEFKIYIEDVRNLKSFLSLKPYQGPYKFALIDDVHCLTQEASNALLKILEEPPSFSIIILVTSSPGLLLPTIISRCEGIRFNSIPEKEMLTYLTSYKKLTQEDRDFLLKLSFGRIGLVKTTLEDGSLSNMKKAIADLRILLNAGVYDRMQYAKKVNEKNSYNQLASCWLYWVGAHVGSSPKNERIVKNLLSLHQIISQPQFNHRLALENFLLSL